MRTIVLLVLLAACTDNGTQIEPGSCEEMQRAVNGWQFNDRCNLPYDSNGETGCSVTLDAYCGDAMNCPPGWTTTCDPDGANCTYGPGTSCSLVDANTVSYDYTQIYEGVRGLIAQNSATGQCEFRPCNPI